MKKQTVSVVIPVYNEEKYISECLSSLAKQTLKPMEIIVVDDGSTDKTRSVLSEFRIKNLELRILRQQHRGPGKARNLGAKKAKGEILVFPDADMKFDKNYLEKLIEPIIEGKAIATFTKEEYVANSENIWSWCWSINSLLPVNLHIDPAMPKEANNFRAILRSVFFKTKGYRDMGYGEDVSVLEQLPQVRAKAAEGAICYHFNPSSLSEVFYSARWMGRGDTFKKNLVTFFTYSIFNSIRKGLFVSFRHRKPPFLIFKLVFDFGIILGMFEREFRGIHAK